MLNIHSDQRVLLIDPVSPEVNRGSFCYLSYLLYCYLQECGVHVELLEEFAVSDLDDIDVQSFHHVYIALWSYPQIEACVLLHHFLHGNVKFYGYFPLIDHLGLPKATIEEFMLDTGMRAYPRYYEDFNYLLLSDCDKHIKDDVKRTNTGSDKMHPLFTSYGCPKGCAFCSATVNNNRKRIEISLQEVKQMIVECARKNIFSIHFTDEDFFYDPARTCHILYWMSVVGKEYKHNFEVIALGHLFNVHRFIERVQGMSKEVQSDVWKPLRLIEIGLESGDATLAAQMGKRSQQSQITPESVHSRCKAPILWLTMTFFPGETISSIYNTGRFMERYGLSVKRMSPRIATNGTVGGLGQFFQYYEGTGMDFSKLKEDGLILTRRPMRLYPSYIPNSFLQDRFSINVYLYKKQEKNVAMWTRDIYGLKEPKQLSRVCDGKMHRVTELVYDMADTLSVDIQEGLNYINTANNAMFLAILARLGIAVPASM